MVYIEWIISLAAISLLAVLLGCTICGCRKVPKNELMGLAGMVKITNPEESMNHNYRQENERASNVKVEIAGQYYTDAADANRRTTTTANRSLPDIPIDPERARLDSADTLWENNEPNGDTCSELYATVEENKLSSLPLVSMQSASRISKIPAASDDGKSSEYSSLSQADDGFAPYAQVKSEHPYDRLKKSEHPYAQVGKNVKQDYEGDPSRQSRLSAAPSGSNSVNPIPPPRSRKSNSFNSQSLSPNLDYSESNIPAATAIAGRISANQELPYMTPPIPTPAMVSEAQTHFSGDSQDSSKGYTSISVREPLANIKAQTRQKSRTKQLTDSHYATVSDDSEEMYAAIDDPQPVYTSGSETYAQIQPLSTVETTASAMSTEPMADGSNAPPQPPSVDSLKHVAQAHSRQASSSSAASSVANLGSPKPEKRQANSPLPPPPAVGHDLYSTVDKKSNRDPPSTEKNLEEMYAKVTKKNLRSIAGSRNDLGSLAAEEINEVEPTNTGDNVSAASLDMSSSRESIESRLQKDIDSLSIGSSFMEVQSDFSSRTDKSDSIHPYQQLSVASALQPSNESTDSFLSLPYTDPGYEAVRKSQLSDIDPNYEEVSRLPLSDSDPNYEVVRKPPLSDSDPNYEVVRKPPLSDSDPNYEVVRKPPLSDSDPNYEVVRGPLLSDSDPNYEELQLKINTAEPDYPTFFTVPSDTNPSVPGYASIGQGPVNTSEDSGYERVSFTNTNSGYASINKIRKPADEPTYETMYSHSNDPPYERLQEDGDITPSYEREIGTSVANLSDTPYEDVKKERYKLI